MPSAMKGKKMRERWDDWGKKIKGCLRRNALVSGPDTAMTLAELLVSFLVLILAVTGILVAYLRCMELNDMSRARTLVVKAAASEMDQVAATSFAQMKTNHHLRTFTVTGLPNSRGVIYVDDTDGNFLGVAVSISWKQKNGRLMGGDKDLDGQIDTGETTKSGVLTFNVLDSPVLLVSKFFRR